MVGEERWTAEMEAEVREAALGAGFHLFGVAGADAGEAEGERFAAWVEAGRAGEMEYLKRRDEDGVLLREGVKVAIPWARSVVVCALNYGSEEALSVEEAPEGAGWIGRYAWSGSREKGEGPAELVATDYHLEMLTRLRVVEATIRSRVACETRCYVDTGPIVERSLAARAGVGWVGKNTCVINQGMGSWLLLGVVITSLEVGGAVAQIAAADRCGSCTRCIEACPTDALVAPQEMDASRCIAYLTIEKKGAIAEELREGMGRQVFGCDICQDVCPWNKRSGKAVVGVTEGMEVRRELVNPSLAWLGSLDNKEFKRWFKGSPLERTGRKRLMRNVAIAMGNSGLGEFGPKLAEWAEGEDEVLAEAARWALERQGVVGSV
ncbi:epoxyqueuosine reductase [Granulicella aggregans]|uniref:Epoxyqueuosine reductase n=1 Tax=Granulicella aggregans TaxID=474949 RepID=A0A7W8E2A0_9BACT|nr:tRNA epoxyqueuosine(34) reductase QueG [Granulicella aggregans]MBB5056131.1 epoxyqueuosine reductase [Granulicella aggregans]